MESNIELRSLLNDLIQTCRDGQEGFLTAAENIGNDEIKVVLNTYSLQRAKFTGELQSAAHELGNSNPENISSLSGTLHRGWMNLKTAIAGRDRHAILEECERGEDRALAAFHQALRRELPQDLRSTLENQCAALQTAHDRIKALRDAAAVTGNA